MSDEHPIQDMYDGKLTPEELQEAEENLVMLFKLLIEMDDALRKKAAERQGRAGADDGGQQRNRQQGESKDIAPGSS